MQTKTETCDQCGEKFALGEDTFLGVLNKDEECSPFTPLTSLCAKCCARRETVIRTTNNGD